MTDGQLRLIAGLEDLGESRRRAAEDVMNFSTLFIRRPVATTLIQLAIIIFGIIGYRALPVSDLPTDRLPDDLR